MFGVRGVLGRGVLGVARPVAVAVAATVVVAVLVRLVVVVDAVGGGAGVIERVGVGGMVLPAGGAAAGVPGGLIVPGPDLVVGIRPAVAVGARAAALGGPARLGGIGAATVAARAAARAAVAARTECEAIGRGDRGRRPLWRRSSCPCRVGSSDRRRSATGTRREPSSYPFPSRRTVGHPRGWPTSGRSSGVASSRAHRRGGMKLDWVATVAMGGVVRAA